MKTKREKLINKVASLWQRAGLPRFLQKFGPRKFESVFLAFAWLVTQEYTRSLRKTQQFLFELGLPVPHWTTIQKAAKRFTASVWSLLHQCTALAVQPYLGLVDSTGLSLSNPSRHYTNVFGLKVSCPTKLSVLVDSRSKKCLAFRFRARQAGDSKDVPYLLRHSHNLPVKLIADSAYDVESQVFEACYSRGVVPVVKPRKNAVRGFYRKRARRAFDLRAYHRRSLVESYFSALKRRYGGSLRCRSARTQRAEITGRIILKNLISLIQKRDFLQSSLGVAVVGLDVVA